MIKKITIILLIWLSVVSIGSTFTFYFFLFLILGPISFFMPSEIQHESFLILLTYSLIYSLPALIIFGYSSLYKSKNMTDMLEEAPGRIIGLTFLTFLGLTIYFYPFLTLIFGFLPYMFATIFVFAIAKNIFKKISQ